MFIFFDIFNLFFIWALFIAYNEAQCQSLTNFFFVYTYSI